ncbi:hypothetical protein M433DRAFT_540396, partial [Acidomyces richmondensis BFW]
VFEPITRPLDPIQRRLLIIDGYSSYITANFIAYCIDKAINMLILLPYSSYILQPLDISIFALLKRALAAKTDAVSQLDSGRISRVEWTEMYIRTVVESDGLSVLRPGESAPKRREESNGNQDRDED